MPNVTLTSGDIIRTVTAARREAAPMTGELSVLAFRPHGLPRARRVSLPTVARQSAAFVARQRGPTPYTPAYIEAQLRGLLRDHPQADACYAGACGPNLITTVGKGFLVDAWQGLVTLADMKYHGPGTGTTAPAVGNTNLQIPCTTALNPDNTRGTGALGELSAGVFRTVGLCTFDAVTDVTEWGLFSSIATSGGTLFARNTFTAIPVGVGDTIVFTWDWTA